MAFRQDEQRQRHRQLYENRREREFYRYYEPIRALSESGPSWTDLHDKDAIKAHRPFSSPDKALTAFCQLGALRLAARRAMLFFFDSNYGYILAEATRSLSLQDDSVHEIEDHLWLGHTIIPRGFSVCEHTINLPSNMGSNRDLSESADVVHVVNDLQDDTRFCDRPYVINEPNARFYAGVPITTPKGINIGAYCILDDNVRNGISDKDVTFLRDMAATVMTHLDMVRAKAEHQRGTRMVTGLGAFVEGASNFHEWEARNSHRDRQLMTSSRLPDIKTATAVKISEETESTIKEKSNIGSMTATPLNNLQVALEKSLETDRVPRVTVQSPKPSQISDRHSPKPPEPPERTPSASPVDSKLSQTKHIEDLQEETLTANVRTTFQRAARLMREAVDVDGSLFLDASVARFGGLVQGPELPSGSEHNSSSEGVATTTDNATDLDEGLTMSERMGCNDHKPCSILGASSSADRDTSFSNSPDRGPAAKEVTVSETFLRSLLRRHQYGKVWNFSEDGYASDDGSSSENASRRRPKLYKSPPRSGANTSESSANESFTPRKRRRRNRAGDAREIQRLFPGVRSLAVMGIWDHVRSRWYGANIIWTYSAMRVLSVEGELSYMAAFCDVVMAEVSRLDAQSADRAKSDFISSISHELRSPLHGMLGSVECLQDQPFLDSFNTGLLSQIETCGRTLLDIIDHLLDFSKINYYAQRDAAKASDPAKRTSKKGKVKLNGMMALDSDVALDNLTEEIIETAVYSFCCSRDKGVLEARNVTVILDIDRACETRWNVYLRTGAYKRICINLVSNALKYTAEGYVLVSLRAAPIPNKKKKFNATLTVTDSGRGMSKDFLENELFRAFSQEDSLAEGTGLGMSLVSKIVKANGGRIEVRSQKGVGTTASVILPLEYSRRKDDENADGSGNVTPPSRPFGNLSIGLIGFADVLPAGLATASQLSPSETARGLLQSTLRKTLGDLGVESHLVGWSVSAEVDVYLITEVDLAEMREHVRQMQLSPGSATSIQIFVAKPLIVLCENAMSARRLRASHIKDMAGSRIAYISQPTAPVGLSKALRECMEQDTTSGSEFTQQAAWNGASPAPSYTSLERDSKALPQRPSMALRRRTTGPSTRHIRPLVPSVSSIPATPQERVLVTPLLSGAASTRLINPDLSSPNDGFPFPPVAPSAHSTPTSPDASNNDHLSPRDIEPLPTPLTAPPAPSTTPKLTLLLVDDNRINLQLLITYADKNRHPKLTASDGAQAVEVYKTACHPQKTPLQTSSRPTPAPTTASTSHHPLQPPVTKPDVILMDINMPNLNGFEATRQIRAFELQWGLKPAVVIALTGLGSADAQREAFGSGVDLFLTKPVGLRELTRVLEGIAGGE
ncbi:hypothetical protein MBLNU230_g2781t1 [Neophaeotheca triangularis]